MQTPERTMIAFIRNRSIRSIAAFAATLSATMEDAPAEPKNDEEFIKQFSAKMDEKEKAAAAGDGEGDEAKPKPVSKKEEVADDASAGGGEEEADDEVETEGEEAEVEASGEEEEGDDDDEGEEGEEDDSEFGKRAKDAKLPTSIDDLPKEARPLVQKRLKEMESGFTRLMQKQAEFRAERRQFQVEERYRETHKVEWLTQELMKDPDLEAQVAAAAGEAARRIPVSGSGRSVGEGPPREGSTGSRGSGKEEQRKQPLVRLRRTASKPSGPSSVDPKSKHSQRKPAPNSVSSSTEASKRPSLTRFRKANRATSTTSESGRSLRKWRRNAAGRSVQSARRAEARRSGQDGSAAQRLTPPAWPRSSGRHYEPVQQRAHTRTEDDGIRGATVPRRAVARQRSRADRMI
jgi:hypothetical protein